MNISLENYEAFFLDYHEGTLPASEVAELFAFLENHPELKEEFRSFELNVIEPGPALSFIEKQGLKKEEVNEKNYMDFLIAKLEGDLTAREEEVLNTFLKTNPSIINEFVLLEKTKLRPDEGILFPEKKSLKKREVVALFPSWSYIAAAASLVLAVGIYFLMKSNTTSQLETSTTFVSESKQPSQPVSPKIEIAPDPILSPGKNVLVKEHKKKEVRVRPAVINPIVQHPIAFVEKMELLAPHDLILQPLELKNDSIRGGVLYAMTLIETNSGPIPTLPSTQEDIAEEPSFHVGGIIGQFAKNNFNKLFGTRKPDEKDTDGDTKTDLWKLANAGTDAIRALTGKDIELIKKTNKNGELTSYSVVAGDFEFSRTKEK